MHVLMNLACRRFKTHQAEIFRVACLHTHQNFTPKEMMQEYKEQTAQGRWEQWVLDTCLDMLAGRIEAKVFLGGEDGWVWIVRPLSEIPLPQQWKKGTLEEYTDDW